MFNKTKLSAPVYTSSALPSAAFLLLLCFAGHEAVAKTRPVSNTRAAGMISSCLLESDHRLKKGSGGMWEMCCSKTLGYCISCRVDGTRACKKFDYHTRPQVRRQDAPKIGPLAPVSSRISRGKFIGETEKNIRKRRFRNRVVR